MPLFRIQSGNRAQVSLDNSTRIECNLSGLHSVEGARKLIAMIESRRIVYTLLISYNRLGDDGCIMLFDFLSSNKGRQHPISEIHLGSNILGNKSLLSIASYIKDNVHLRYLALPNNAFTGDSHAGLALAVAVNASRLETLDLASNNRFSDPFISSFLPSLECRSLHDLNLAATGITSASVPHIADHLSSDRCYLNTFSCNGNHLGNADVYAIYQALNTCHNYRLTKLNIFANFRPSDEDGESALAESQIAQSLLRLLVARNMHLNIRVQNDALRLLRYSRPLLLHSTDATDQRPGRTAPCNDTCSCYPLSQVSSKPSSPPSSDPPYLKLPTEIKHYILSFLAPNLSAGQRSRIFRYASSTSTLPQLLPCLPNSTSGGTNHSVCVPDPSNLAFGDANKIRKTGGGGVGAGGGCASGKCLGSSNSVICHREQDSKVWLASIGCDAHEHDGEAPSLDALRKQVSKRL